MEGIHVPVRPVKEECVDVNFKIDGEHKDIQLVLPVQVSLFIIYCYMCP